MLNEIISSLTAGPALLSEESVAWVEACMAGVENLRLEEALAADDVRMQDDFWPEPDSRLASYRPYNVKDGVLTIPVKGVLVNDLPYAIGGFVTGYTYLAKAVQRGMEDAEVKGIAFEVNSPGGAVAGNFDLVDLIHGYRGDKPMRAFAASHAYSAAYSIASAADSITVDRTGGVGSIGVVTWHADYSKALEKAGIVQTPIFAGKHKVDGNQFQPLPDNVKKQMQVRIDKLYGIFVQTVARNRGMPEQSVRDTEALTFDAEEATNNGLADAVGSFEDSVAAFSTELNKTQSGGYAMSTTEKDDKDTVSRAAHDQALTEARTAGMKEGAQAAQDRITGILNCEEAANRREASFNLAFETELTVEQAVNLLKKLPEDKATAENGAGNGNGKSPFDRAMSEGNPGIGALGDEGDEGDEGEKDPVAQILADTEAATGHKFSKAS